MEDLNPVGFSPHENPLEQRIEFLPILQNSYGIACCIAILEEFYQEVGPRSWKVYFVSLSLIRFLCFSMHHPNSHSAILLQYLLIHVIEFTKTFNCYVFSQSCIYGNPMFQRNCSANGIWILGKLHGPGSSPKCVGFWQPRAGWCRRATTKQALIGLPLFPLVFRRPARELEGRHKKTT